MIEARSLVPERMDDPALDPATHQLGLVEGRRGEGYANMFLFRPT